MSRWRDGDREVAGVDEFDGDDEVVHDDEDVDVDDDDDDVDDDDEAVVVELDEVGGDDAVVATADTIADSVGSSVTAAQTTSAKTPMSASGRSEPAVLLMKRSYSSRSCERETSVGNAGTGDGMAGSGGVSDRGDISDVGRTASAASSNMSKLRFCGCGWGSGRV